MLSRYRCECRFSFAGHNCAETTSLHPLDSKCRLASGAKSEEGATATKKDYVDFQAALKFFGVSLLSGVNFELFCVDVYHRRERGGVCGQTFVLQWKSSTKTQTVKVDCTHKGQRKEKELYVVLEICAKPCMNDETNKCELWDPPLEFVRLFPCYRSDCPNLIVPVLTVRDVQ